MTLGRIASLVALTLLVVAASLALAPRTAIAAQLDSEEEIFLHLINNYRANNALGAVSVSGALTDSARWMSNDMAAKNYWPDDQYCAQFSMHAHCDSLGRDPVRRMLDFGYPFYTWKAENLAAATETAQLAFDMWRASPGHNANMLTAELNEIGISRVFNHESSYGWYWTTHFGGQPALAAQAPSSDASPEPSPTYGPADEQILPSPTVAPEPAAHSASVDDTNDAAPADRDIGQTIYLELDPLWRRLMVVGGDDRVLRELSRLAGMYLEVSSGGSDSTSLAEQEVAKSG